MTKRTGITPLISETDFLGGIRAVIPEKNILIDNTFLTAFENEERFTFRWRSPPISKTAEIYGINGSCIHLKGNTGFKMSEMVYVGEENLVGEVISLKKEATTVQVFEETSGLRPGETVTASGDAISVTLGPGILNNFLMVFKDLFPLLPNNPENIFPEVYKAVISGYRKTWDAYYWLLKVWEVYGENYYCRSSGNRVHSA